MRSSCESVARNSSFSWFAACSCSYARALSTASAAACHLLGSRTYCLLELTDADVDEMIAVDIEVGDGAVVVYADDVLLNPLRTNGDALLAQVDAEAAKPSSDRETGQPAVRVPVCYGGELGPDLAAVAAFSHLDEAEA